MSRRQVAKVQVTNIQPSLASGSILDLSSAPWSDEGPRSYIIKGSAIHTMDDARPRVEAIGVIGERIVAVGTVAEVTAALPPDTTLFDVGARTVVPGFTDSHNHFAYLARKWQAVDLDGCATVDEALDRVQEFLRARPDVAWIDGHGWDGNMWGELPTRGDLDRIVSDRPVALTSKDGHALWANTEALQAARLLGDSALTPEELPFEESLILREEGTGEPTGIVYETGVKFILAALPTMDPVAVAEAIAAGIPQLHAQGITAVHCPEQPDDWRAYQTLRATGRLGVRVTYWLPVAQLEEAISLGLATGVGDEWLRFGPVKLFADGTLGQRTAAMLAPYEGESDNKGVLLYEDEELIRLVRRAVEHGWAVAIHAIGDGAVRQGLNALEAAGVSETASDLDTAEGGGGLRHRIEHAQLIHPEDVARFAQLGVIASMQPLHCPADQRNAERYWGERTAHAFSFRSLLDAGATLSFGSDAPFGLDLTVNSFSVLAGIDAAVNRADVDRVEADRTDADRVDADRADTDRGPAAEDAEFSEERKHASGDPSAPSNDPSAPSKGPSEALANAPRNDPFGHSSSGLSSTPPSVASSISSGISSGGSAHHQADAETNLCSSSRSNVRAWHPEQTITIDEALRAFTIDAAFAGGEEGWRGSLTPGKMADIVVLSDDLHAVNATRIADVRVDATFVAGRLVHGELA